MTNFGRALGFAWKYRGRFVLSIVCAMLVALFWGGNLSAVYPILKVFFKKQNLHEWVDHEVDRLRARIAELDARSSDSTPFTPLPQPPGKGGETDSAVPAPASSDPTTRQLERLRVAWSLRWFERLQPIVHRFVPADRGRTLLLVIGLLFTGLALKGLFLYLNETLVGAVTHRAMFDLRNKLFRHTMRTDLASFTETGTSELMSRFTNDVETLSVGMETLIGKMIREPLKAAACIGLACWLNGRLTLVVIALVPLAVVLISTIGRSLKRATRRYLESMSSIYRLLHEGLQGIKIVKAFTMERTERRRFRAETKNYFHKVMRIVRLEALVSPLTELVGVGAISVAVLVGAFLVIGETEYERTHVFGVCMAAAPMDPEALALLYTLLAGVSDPLRKLSNVYGRIQRAAAAADRVFGFLDREPTIVDRPELPTLPRHAASIEFHNVQFSYEPWNPAAPRVLNDVTLRVRFGETIALVGPNGSGKTTLVNLILRFYDPIAGAVLVDGHDLRDVRLHSLREQIGIVTQETVLFNDTIAANIAYGRPYATRDEIEAAAKKAHAHRFIGELPAGYETIVGEHAVKLSGGQRQRIALARAILRDPPILILDEATSSLDVESESLIHRVLEEFVRGRTTVLVTHRLSTLELADRIVVLNAGRIIDAGTHSELLRRCELYTRLHEIHGSSRASA
jgi:ABC-type multidrug transport system fused ATPase/permease subunit